MAYINVRIDRHHEVTSAKYDALKEAETKFWEDKAEEYRKQLQNTFEAIKEHGYVELHFDNEVITLVPGERPNQP